VTNDRRLPRCRILKSASRIGELFQVGQRRHGRLIMLLLSRSERPRAAFVVPKRYGPAVLRNRQKRRLRELYRQNRERFPAGQDVVLYLKSPRMPRGAAPEPPAPAGWQDLRRDLDAILGACAPRPAADHALPAPDLPA
jgi:ribonuclease P protein component